MFPMLGPLDLAKPGDPTRMKAQQARRERAQAGKTLGRDLARGNVRDAAAALIEMKQQERDDADVDALDALVGLGHGGSRRRRMRGGVGEEEAAARAAYAEAKKSLVECLGKTRALVGRLVSDNLLTIVGTSFALQSGLGQTGVALAAAGAGVAAPYVIGGAVSLMAAMAIYRVARTILMITAEEAQKVGKAAEATAIVQDLKAIDLRASEMIAGPDPVQAAKDLFNDPKYKDAVKAAFRKGAAKQLEEALNKGKAAAAKEKRAAARAAREAAAKAAAAAAPPAEPVAAEAAEAAGVEEAEAAKEEVAAANAAADEIEREADSKAPAGQGGRRRSTSRRHRRASGPRRTRRSSSGRHRGYSRRRRE
jgi:hypothetical protein